MGPMVGVLGLVTKGGLCLTGLAQESMDSLETLAKDVYTALPV